MPQPGESSVEEILESIKKVIARDNRTIAAEARVRRERAAKAGDKPEPATQDAAQDEAQDEAGEILNLDEAMVSAESDDGMANREFVESDDVAGETSEPLLTDIASKAMRDNLAALAMMATPPAAPQIVRSGETSLEGLTRELLRPMLAEWLDTNLPAMVEQMVQAEISRIAGKRG